jgi:hypothetical protein
VEEEEKEQEEKEEEANDALGSPWQLFGRRCSVLFLWKLAAGRGPFPAKCVLKLVELLWYPGRTADDM